MSLDPNLPAPISMLIGRERELSELVAQISAHRLITLTGAGGIGKTQLGLEVARLMLPRFSDGAWMVELSPLVDPELISSTVAHAVGIELGHSRSPAEQLTAALGRKHLLLVLDNCEHLIEATARLVEMLLRAAPRLHVLATSQELLTAEGEHVYRVMPLDVPLTDIHSGTQAIKYSAVDLFVQRVRAAEPLFSLDDDKAAAATSICRHLDGIPLAIELAAARVATIGLGEIARRLDDRFRLLKGGRRTALRRHQTLRATLDWSYGLLSETARAVLCRLAVFAGSFTLQGAAAVAGGDTGDECQMADHLADLVSKSLVVFDDRGQTSRYRLLETTRTYALEKLAETDDLAAVRRRHADYYRKLICDAGVQWQTIPAADLVAKYAPEIDNIRVALNWAFEPGEDADTGVALSVATVPLWTLLSMLGECKDFVSRALSVPGMALSHQMRHEMMLQAALAKSSLWAQGSVTCAAKASQRVLDLARDLHDAEYQLQALYVLWICRLRVGEYRASAELAEQFQRVAESITDLSTGLTGIRLGGVSSFYLGDLGRSRVAMERVLGCHSPNLHGSFAIRFGLDQQIAARGYLARILWLQGFPDQAADVARINRDEVRRLNHGNSLCNALCESSCLIAAANGDLQATDDLATELIHAAEQHGLGMWEVDGLAFKGWVAVKRGDGSCGLSLLQRAFEGFRETRADLRHTIFVEALAEAWIAVGQVGEGMATIHTALDESLAGDGYWRVPELLRLRGEFTLCAMVTMAEASAEKDFTTALELAGRQGALAWRLRAATSLARLWHRQGRATDAYNLVAPIYESFSEGFETADLHAAKGLIKSLL